MKTKIKKLFLCLVAAVMIMQLLPASAFAVSAGDMNFDAVSGDGYIIVSWDALETENVTYTVFSSDENGGNYTEHKAEYVCAEGRYTYVIEGLENDKTYSVGVEAISDSFKYGSMSAMADATPYSADATVPSMPAITELIEEGNTITVSWEAPLNDGGAKITGYEIECWPEGSEDGNGGMTIGIDADVTTYTIDGFPEENVKYEVKICAVNAVGRGAYGVYGVREFEDVHPVNHWAKESIDFVCKNGLMNGTEKARFAPDTPLTRAMLVTILYRLEGEPRVSGITSYEDLKEGQYYLDAVCWAQVNGIAFGVSDTEFAPDDNITREQIAAIMLRYANYKGVGPVGAWAIRLDYADLSEISDYATEGIMFCKLKGIMQGRDGNVFAPKDNATRAEAAAILESFTAVAE